jgi:6-phosphogluconate dehydrogenase
MAQRLMTGGHELVGFDQKLEARQVLEANGAQSADSLGSLVAKLSPPRVVWIMVPAGTITDDTLAKLLPLLAAGDTVIDGGNSNYKDTLRRGKTFADNSINFVDCGTSGGIWGVTEGYCMMIGGQPAAVEYL